MSSAVILIGSRLVMSSMGGSLLCSVILRCDPRLRRGEPRRTIGHWAATCSLFTVGLMAAFVYIVRCSDDSFYVGSATGNDLNRRIAEHRTGAFPGYTSPNQYGELDVTLVRFPDA